MARKITVQLIGDSDSLERAFSKSEAKGKSFGRTMGVSGASLKTFAKAGAAGAAVGGLALVAKGLTSSVAAAKEAEVAQVNLEQALKSAGKPYAAYGKQIDAAIQKTSKLAALDDEELSGSFANLVRSTGSVTKATKGMALAANIARARNVPLATATKAVERAFKGSDTALKRYGIVIPKVTASVDKLKAKEKLIKDQMEGTKGARREQLQAQLDAIKAQIDTAKAMDKTATMTRVLDAAQKKFAGSARDYGNTSTGAQEKLAIALENVQEKIGAKLLPLQLKLTNAVLKFIEWGEKNWPRFSKAVSDVWAKVRPVFEAFKSYFGGFVKIIQGIIQGDWSLAWKGVKQVVSSAFDLAIAYLKAVPARFFALGLRMGKALANGVIAGIGNLVDRITDKIPGLGDEGIPPSIQRQIDKARARAARSSAQPRTSGGHPPVTTPYAGPRAKGGPALANRSYLVGENGPERLTMGSTSGRVTPNGGNTYYITANLPGVTNPQEFLAQLQRIARHGVAQQRGQHGGTNLALT